MRKKPVRNTAQNQSLKKWPDQSFGKWPKNTKNNRHTMKINAAPGIAVITPIEEKASEIITTDKKQGRIQKGKILSMGRNVITDANALLEASFYGKEGDIVYFLSYYEEGGYDYATVNGEKYYFVKWQDFRGVIND